MNFFTNDPKGDMYIIGKSMLFASVQVAFASIELDSKFAIREIKTQERLDDAITALKSYLVISIFWTISNICILYSLYGVKGAFYSFISNMTIIIWIMITYKKLFKHLSEKYELYCSNLF